MAGNVIGLSNLEKISIIATVISFAVLVAVSYYFLFILKNAIMLALSMGACGGIAHELAQSQGKIPFFKKYEDGMYLGSLSGAILGLIAGFLIVRGLAQSDLNTVWFEAFLAGLGLKGIAEATAGNPISKL